MKAKKITPEPGPSNQKDRSLLLLLAAGILGLLVSVTFYLTYPINAGQSDNPTFMSMIISGRSNLMHASGYPALVHFFTYKALPILPPVASLTEVPPDAWFQALQRVQLVVHLSLFLISLCLCAKAFNNSVAAIFALGWGCNALFISNVNAIAPEWLQGHALILSLLLHAYARRLAGKGKMLVYSLAAGVFATAYLIKFNSLLFAICLVAFLVFDKESWPFKFTQMGCSVAAYLFVIWAYVSFYHLPTTGTRELTYDHAWVLTAALPDDYETAAPERLGTNSLRWAALVRVTPPEYFRAGGIDNVSFGPPPEVRQQFAEQFTRITNASREELIQYIKGQPLPAGYSHWAAAVPLYFYYGLEKTDALGIEVYRESLASHWWFHTRKIASSLAEFFVSGLNSIQTFPTFGDPLGYKFLAPDFKASLLGKTTIVPPPDISPWTLEYYNPKGTVSFYGVKIIAAINSLSAASVLYFVLNITALLGLFKLKSNFQRVVGYSLLLTFLAFISASGILLGLRQKEIIALTPAYFLLLSIGLLSAARTLNDRFGKSANNPAK